VDACILWVLPARDDYQAKKYELISKNQPHKGLAVGNIKCNKTCKPKPNGHPVIYAADKFIDQNLSLGPLLNKLKKKLKTWVAAKLSKICAVY
jgi:hypothetical protein